MIQLNVEDISQSTPEKAFTLSFARHETFHPRFSWLKKGFDAASQNSNIFLQEDAPVRLGVGKNMVRSIRYWCRAFKVLENDQPTEFGEKLLGNGAWDPFLEDPASLWLLHWNLLKPTCEAAAWYYVFNLFRQVEFTADDLMREIQEYTSQLGRKIADSSIKKDVTCLLRMYVEQGDPKKLSEDSIDSPFTTLNLIQSTGDSKHYLFKVGQKLTLPLEVIVASCLEFAASRGTQKTISIATLAYEMGSPGLVFKLGESAIYDAIEAMTAACDSLMLSDTAGLIQFSFKDDPIALANDILDKYFQARNGNVS
ncbi:MAG: DUF4007 family protein [Halothece sp. Uz-M2-17]|nr:DUF4007 family protein [Halothece sp. Uz-M2-17]